jgi:hypothetical protein
MFTGDAELVTEGAERILLIQSFRVLQAVDREVPDQ